MSTDKLERKAFEVLSDDEIDEVGLLCSDYDDPAFFRVMARAVETKIHMNARAALRAPAESPLVNTKLVAPWPDFAGNPIFAGDTICHPASGEVGEVLFLPSEKEPSDQWRVLYRDSAVLSRLCLQIGDKGRAVVRAATPQAPASEPTICLICTRSAPRPHGRMTDGSPCPNAGKPWPAAQAPAGGNHGH